jgi:hypothetical protein
MATNYVYNNSLGLQTESVLAGDSFSSKDDSELTIDHMDLLSLLLPLQTILAK